jgi:two-component system chemotaxis response regulator CheB
MDAQSRSYLPELLARRTKLAVKFAEEGELLCASTVYVAAPGRHLLIGSDRRCLPSDEPPLQFSRPSADALFVSAAEVFGSRTLGVILTGRLRDGTLGAAAIRRAGGVVLAQDPATCRAPAMPEAAIQEGLVHVAMPPAALGAALSALVAVPGARALFGLNTRVA